MYWRMLKRDIKDKPALNIVTFIFMIAAVSFTVIGVTLLYSLFGGAEKTYEKCNSSDIIALVDRDYSDEEGFVQKITEDLESFPISKEVINKEVVTFSYRCIEAVGSDTSRNDYQTTAIVDSMARDYDVPINMNNEYFEVEDGYVAVSQTYANLKGVKEGDKIRITTQMGNIYEFVISTVYKNPVANALTIFYLSDNDKEMIYSESPYKTELFTLSAKPIEGDYVSVLTDTVTPMLVDYKDHNITGNATRIIFFTNEGLFALIVSICMIIVAVIIMCVAMITIDFSLKSSIKRDEREIGMMKAIGVWSFSYKTLFIIKYVAFAVVGGALGIPAGFFISKLVFDKFVMHVMFPDPLTLIFIGGLAGGITVLLIILSSFFSLRRMRKISVIDAIHGDNRGERFTRIPGLFLNNKKHIPVPFFLALSDILRGFKRYFLLVIAYVLGISVVLFIVRLESTIMDPGYSQHYFQFGREDFEVEFDESYYTKLYSGAGSYRGVIDIVNKNFENNGIPATMYTKSGNYAEMITNGTRLVCVIEWMDSPSSEIRYIDGGNAPKLRNEVAIGYYFAEQYGIKLGDSITIEYEKLGEDRISHELTSEEFIVTAFFDQYGSQTPSITMGDEFEGSIVQYEDLFSCVLDAPSGQYDEYLAKMRSLYPNDEIKFIERDKVMEHHMPGYGRMFNLIIIVVSITAAVVIMLLSSLYENIFIDEETSDIALLKSMGFGKGAVRSWHFWRLMLLSLLSLGLSYVFTSTIAEFLIGKLFQTLMRAKEFNFFVSPISNYVIVPICVIVLLVAVIMTVTKLADRIEIWKVRNE